MDGLFPATPIVPKVVVDRYRKRIKEEDINRGTANYAKSAGAGALAGLVARFKKTQAGRRAAIGAGAGILVEGAVRAAGRATKDPYGERSHAAKSAETLPVAAGVTTAGVLAYKRLKRAAREFGMRNAGRRNEIQFAIPAPLRRKLIAAVALGGGITAADVATRTAFPGDDDRKAAATKGLKEGAIYGGVLAGTEPVISTGLRRIARRLNDRRIIFEFRALTPVQNKNDEDLARQRRKLALYAGGALAGAGALALLARSGRGAPAAAAVVKPAGRGTLERLAAANKLRAERGHVFMKPMMPGQRKRFDKLPAQTQVNAGKVARLATNPALSPGEHQKMRQWLGRIRTAHKFSRNSRMVTSLHRPIHDSRFTIFSSFVKDVKFKDLPARARVDIRAFHPDMKSSTRLAHYGMTVKELAGKADKDNLAAARRNVGKMSRKAAADEVYRQRGKKFVLVNNDRIFDGHHYIAKAERGNVTASLHVIDLTPARFQTALERRLRSAVEFAVKKNDNGTFKHDVAVGSIEGGAGVLATDRLIRRFVPEGSLAAKKILIGAGVGGLTTAGIGYGLAKLLRKQKTSNAQRRTSNAHLERRLRNPVYFMYSDGGSVPQGDALPEWVTIRRGNAKWRQRLHTAAQVAGVAGGTATVAAAVHSILTRKKAVKSLKDYLKGVGLSDVRVLTYFRRREQLREGGKSEAEKGSGRFVDPISVAAGLRPAYSISPGGERRFYGGVGGGDLAITHAQVLRSAVTHGSAIRKYTHRAGSLVRDAADVAVGNPRRTDAYGRPQRREWEKPWFGRAAKDVAIGGVLLGGALALKKSPKLRGRMISAGAEIRRKVNKAIPDFFADWGPRMGPLHYLGELRNIDEILFGEPIAPYKFNGKIDYRRQNAMYEWAKQLRHAVRRRAGLPIRPPIAGSLPAKPSSVVRGFSGSIMSRSKSRSRIIEFDDIANWAGWDVRDPRGRSARVFAPGGRKRMRREKEWHERVDVQRKLLGALAAVGTVAGIGGGIAIGRKYFPVKPVIKPKLPRKVVPVKFA